METFTIGLIALLVSCVILAALIDIYRSRIRGKGQDDFEEAFTEACESGVREESIQERYEKKIRAYEANIQRIISTNESLRSEIARIVEEKNSLVLENAKLKKDI